MARLPRRRATSKRVHNFSRSPKGRFHLQNLARTLGSHLHCVGSVDMRRHRMPIRLYLVQKLDMTLDAPTGLVQLGIVLDLILLVDEVEIL